MENKNLQIRFVSIVFLNVNLFYQRCVSVVGIVLLASFCRHLKGTKTHNKLTAETNGHSWKPYPWRWVSGFKSVVLGLCPFCNIFFLLSTQCFYFYIILNIYKKKNVKYVYVNKMLTVKNVVSEKLKIYQKIS